MSYRNLLGFAGVAMLGIFFTLQGLDHHEVRLCADQPKAIGVNYYSKGRLWRDFWQSFEVETIRKDFRMLRDLGMNTVRVFVFHEIFTQQPKRAVSQLELLLDLAEGEHLKVVLTLFDWSKPYGFSLDSEDFQRGSVEILQSISKHPALLMVDLKNEPDHDFVSEGRERVDRWLVMAHKFLKSRFSGLQWTVGWLWLFPDLSIQQHLDVLSFHHFPEQGSLSERLHRFQREFPNRALFLEEVGYSTHQNERMQLAQKRLLDEALWLTVRENLMGVLVWTMHDHPTDQGPQRPPHENGFGLFDLQGRSKVFTRSLTHASVWSPDRTEVCFATGEGTVQLSLMRMNRWSERLRRGYYCLKLGPLSAWLSQMGVEGNLEFESAVGWNLEPLSQR